MAISNRKKVKYIKELENFIAADQTEDMPMLRKTEIENLTDTMRTAKLEKESLPKIKVKRPLALTKQYYKAKLIQSEKLNKQQQHLLDIRREIRTNNKRSNPTTTYGCD